MNETLTEIKKDITEMQDASVVDDVRHALLTVDVARNTLKLALEKLEPKPKVEMRPREYGICYPITMSRQIVEGDKVVKTDKIELNPGDKMSPGDYCTFTFGVEILVDPGTPGLPETVWKSTGVDRYFRFDSLVIEDDIVDNFEICGIFGGALNAIRGFPGINIPAKRFAASIPRVKFDDLFVNPGIAVQVNVKCIGKEPTEFKAKVIGMERAPETSGDGGTP